MNLFVELSLIIFLATALALIARLLRQPLIVAYIATGVLAGPYALNIIQSHEEIELFSKIGIAILLFIVGLTLNPDVMREVGRVSLITGIGQVLFTSVLGYLILVALGFNFLTSFYVAVALTFSSTIIILKLLSDRGDTQKLYGKISIGFLLVQDIVATLILLVITVVGVSGLSSEVGLSSLVGAEIGVLFLKGMIAALVLYLVSKYVLPSVSQFIANSQEMLFTFSLAWGLGMATLFQYIGFSVEIGALIAGATLAASPFAFEIASRMKPLRDFFILLFFVLLGSQLILGQISALLVPAAVLSAFVLIGNPLIVLIIMNLMGYRTRVAFMSGLTVAQISEFSLILIALGYGFGHVSQETVSLVTLVGIITIAGSTYLILYADRIYSFLKPVLRILTIRKSHMQASDRHEGIEILIFGYDRVGRSFVEAAKKLTSNFMVVDFDPRSIDKLRTLGIPYHYGDAEDVDFLEEIEIGEAKLVVSTIPDIKTNILLASHYRSKNPYGILITISHDVEGSKELYRAGASYVVMPHHLGAHHAAMLMEKYGFNTEAFDKERDEHMSKLTSLLQ